MVDGRQRVIVGVHDSLAGLRALRRAVAEARVRDAELHALRAWVPPSAGYTPMLRVWDADQDTVAKDEIRLAFAAAMGGPPCDVAVRFVSVQALAGPALVEYACRDDDLLVVGVGRHGLAGRLAGRSVAHYCLHRAVCPVLAVPADQFAVQASTRSSLRELAREVRQLTESRLPA